MVNDHATEQWLTGHGVDYELHEEILISSIDRERSRRNQARVSTPIDEDTVLVYATALENGEVLPPPVLAYFQSTGKYVTVDGNHRIEAHDLAEHQAICAYVVKDLGETMMRILTFEANARHGLPTSIDERVQQAIYLTTLNVPVAEAARMLRIPAKRIEYAIQQARGQSRVAAVLGRDSSLGGNAKRRLAAIRSDTVLRAAAVLAEQANLTNPEISDLVTAINRKATDDDQLMVVQKEVGRRQTKVAATAGGKVYLPEALIKLEKAIAALDRVDASEVISSFPKVGEGMKMVLISKINDQRGKLLDIVNGEVRHG